MGGFSRSAKAVTAGYRVARRLDFRTAHLLGSLPHSVRHGHPQGNWRRQFRPPLAVPRPQVSLVYADGNNPLQPLCLISVGRASGGVMSFCVAVWCVACTRRTRKGLADMVYTESVHLYHDLFCPFGLCPPLPPNLSNKGHSLGQAHRLPSLARATHRNECLRAERLRRLPRNRLWRWAPLPPTRPRPHSRSEAALRRCRRAPSIELGQGTAPTVDRTGCTRGQAPAVRTPGTLNKRGRRVRVPRARGPSGSGRTMVAPSIRPGHRLRRTTPSRCRPLNTPPPHTHTRVHTPSGPNHKNHWTQGGDIQSIVTDH